MVYASNQKASFDYQLLEKFEAGIVLSGHEVKAVKNGKTSIKGAYVKILGGEAWLVGAIISPYQPGNVPENYDSQVSRKLLLKSKELKYLTGKSQEKGLTLVPIKLYDKNGLIKLEVAISRGKKKYDKRETIKEREFERRQKRLINN